jgi:hypothetical protein
MLSKRRDFRAGRDAGLVALIAFLAIASSVRADPCSGIPECQEQKQITLTLKPFQGKGWAYYCNGDFPFYRNWSKSETGRGPIAVNENIFAEGQNPSKFDASMMNWNLTKSATVTITLGCSKIGKDTNCNTITPDPQCPITNGPHQWCTSIPPVVCTLRWYETCQAPYQGHIYWACITDALGNTWCNCK